MNILKNNPRKPWDYDSLSCNKMTKQYDDWIISKLLG